LTANPTGSVDIFSKVSRRGDGLAVNDRVRTRLLPLALLAVLSFIVGMIVGCPGNPNQQSAKRYLEAWSQGDYEAMHAELDTESREALPLAEFTAGYEKSEATATMISLVAGEEVSGNEERALVPATVSTRAFGKIDDQVEFEFGSDGIAWSGRLLFPGLGEGEELTRKTELAERAPILAANGETMAGGPALAREYPLGTAMIDVTGVVEPAGEDLSLEEIGLGFDPGESIGSSGLERAFNSRLTGKPGGTLYASPEGQEGGRVLGQGKPEASGPLKTTINPRIQEAAANAIAPVSGGIAVLDVRSGAIRAVAGQAYSILRPPGSTMKIVTATAGLKVGETAMSREYPFQTSGVADGREIRNAGGKVCGGSLTQSFADSCNSVFAPMGMAIGEEALTETSELFGFNREPAMFDEATTAIVDPPVPTIPQPGDYNNELGVSAIGQGKVQATPLLMASVAQAIANRGVVLPTPFTREKALRPDVEPRRVASRKVAAQVAKLMVAVVTSGTGTSASIPEGQVAGKTGTAEIRDDGQGGLIEDAWFSGFAPSNRPRLAVGVSVLETPGGGGAVAAPIASAVLSAGL
jgi:peptidoglycan glycosyltransferase